MRSFLVATVVVASVAFAGASSAVDTTSDTTGGAIPPAGGERAEEVLAGESWGFEPGEGFLPGWIGVQVGWTSLSGTAEAHIETANPRSGAQHLRVQMDPAIGMGSVGAVSPFVHDMVPDPSSVSVWVSISAGYGCGVDLLSQGGVTASVFFDGVTGQIMVRDQTGLVDTGFDWIADSYAPLRIDVDPADDLITYRIGGTPIHVSNVFGGTVVEQVQFMMPNFSDTVADFDGLAIDRGCVGPACHRWTFTADASDSVGDRDALPSTGASISGGALVLDGIDDFAVLPIADTLQALTDVSVEAWVVWRGGSAWERIFDFGNNTNVNWFMTPNASQTGRPRVAITMGGTASEQRVDAVCSCPLDELTHLVYTLDGDAPSDQGNLFMNGTLVGTYDGALPLDPAELGRLDHIYVGKSQYPADPYFEGKIDEFAIYGTALTPAQVLDLFRVRVFSDGFESGDTSGWSAGVPEATPRR